MCSVHGGTIPPSVRRIRKLRRPMLRCSCAANQVRMGVGFALCLYAAWIFP